MWFILLKHKNARRKARIPCHWYVILPSIQTFSDGEITDICPNISRILLTGLSRRLLLTVPPPMRHTRHIARDGGILFAAERQQYGNCEYSYSCFNVSANSLLQLALHENVLGHRIRTSQTYEGTWYVTSIPTNSDP